MIPVILSGGTGSRLWPISRQSYPKQFCEVFDEPLLKKTLKRLSHWKDPYVVTVKSLSVLTEKTIQSLKIPLANVIYEPTSKNTAPAVALLCLRLLREGKENEVIGVFPADHMIFDEAELCRVVDFAALCAGKGKIATIGIAPAYPATGFGYIECSSQEFLRQKNLVANVVSGFREKPDLETSKKLIEAKNFYWNAGIFVFQVKTMIQAFESHLPELWKSVQKIQPDGSNLKEVYQTLQPLSIDVGIMEKFSEQVCVPCDMGWSDLGSWDDFSKMNDALATSEADVHSVDANNNFIFSLKKKTVGVVGVDDLIVVDTPDALLISQKGKTQNIKALVDQLNSKKNIHATEHSFDIRPWGQYEILSDNNDYKVKVISVDPDQQISYQSHARRQEHWVVISGKGDVILEDQRTSVRPGSVIKIPKNTKHRVKNTGHQILKFVEVQTGDYFGEDDIICYEDDYQRI